MAILPAEQADLFLPLFEGTGQPRQWEGFLDALLARTQARRAAMIIAPALAQPGEPPMITRRNAARAAQEPALDPAIFTKLGLQPLHALRMGRVYALDELLDHDDPARRDSQRSALAAQGIGFARVMRVADAWVALTRAQEDFSASAAALLSATAPYLRAALGAAAALAGERLARDMAEAALSQLGIGQVALDAGARVISADALAERHLPFLAMPGPRPARKLLLPSAAADTLEACCGAFAAAAEGRSLDPVLIALEGRPALLVRPANALPAREGMERPVAIATLRLPVREDERRGAAVLRALYRLSPREAALAEKLSRGETIVEAGRDLHLTAETARNYSKRIYARTGSRGAPDLVRRILSSLVPLA